MKSFVLSFVILVSLVSVTFAQSSSISVWATIPLNESVRLSPQPPLTFNSSCPSSPDAPLITVNTSSLLQPLIGFGAALTETTAYNFLLLKQRNATAYSSLLSSLFSPPPLGIAISFLRVPITSCDLSLPTPGWSYDDTPNDLDLSNFNTSHGQAYQIPVLQDIMRIAAGNLRLIGSPWSAPAWIKDSKAWGYGTIVDEYYPWYAKYLVKLVQTFKDLGIPLYGLTLQNEPRFEPGSYPGTALSPLNESTLANLLHPALRAAGLDTLVAAYDHNWDLVQYPLDVMELVGGAGKSVDVMAFHCYAGGVQNQTVFHDAYPTVPIWFTECSQTGAEGTARRFLSDFMSNLDGLYFGNINNWGQTVLHWSMAVDSNFGPHSGGCGTCSGVVTVDAGNMSRPYVVEYNSEYYEIGHFSSLIPPMSHRVVSGLVGGGGGGGVQVLGALTPTGQTVLQLLNDGTTNTQVTVMDEARGECFITTLPAQSLTSYRWDAPQVAQPSSTGVEAASSSSGVDGAEQRNGVEHITVSWMGMLVALIGLVLSW